MTKNLILVGGLGFVGRNIIDNVLNRPEFAGLTPVVIDDMSNAAGDHESLDIQKHVGGYQAPEALTFLDGLENSEGGRVFVFLAGETRVAESKDRPLDFIDANIAEPSRFVLSAIKPGDQFILISTAGALFDGTFQITVDSPYCPKNFYGATKAAEEMVLEKLVELRGGSFHVVRLTNVYGRFSDKKKSAIHAFTRAVISGDKVQVNGDGKQSRDFIFSGDVGFGVATLASKLAKGETANKVHMLGSGASTTLLDVVNAVELAAGKTLNREMVAATELLKTEPRDVIASPDDVRVLLGDNITPFEEGIRQTYEFYSA